MSLKEGYKRTSKIVFKAPVREKKGVVVNGIDLLENVPPRTENEVGQHHTAPSSPGAAPLLFTRPQGWLGLGNEVSPVFTPILSILPPLQHGACSSGQPALPAGRPGITLLKAFPEILPWKNTGRSWGSVAGRIPGGLRSSPACTPPV